MQISPGDSTRMEKVLTMDTRYVGVTAAYRDLDNAVWRGVIETPIDETTYIDLTLDKLTLRLKKGEK
jgi:type VI secretion system protein VasD